jgi:hypothetical protein
MVAKASLAIAATIAFAVPALVEVSNGVMSGAWSFTALVYVGLALLAAGEAAGASDHATREDAEASHRAR